MVPDPEFREAEFREAEFREAEFREAEFREARAEASRELQLVLDPDFLRRRPKVALSRRLPPIGIIAKIAQALG